MVYNMYVALVGVMMVLPLVQPQRVTRCQRNVRCPCGFESGGVTQERFCRQENLLNPKCCTDGRIPPFFIPLTTPSFNTQFNNFRRLIKRSGSSWNGIPFETVDDGQSTLPKYQRVVREASSSDDQRMPSLKHSNHGPRATDVEQTPEVMSKAPEVLSTADQSHGSSSPVANVPRVDLIKFDTRVIGGNESIALKHAWLVFITFQERRPGAGTAICGGTLISSLLVLTTAHCFFELDGSRRKVKKVDLGRFDLNNNRERYAVIRRARDYFVHPDYNQFTRTQIDDIALIQLDAPSIDAGNGVVPAFLPSDTEDSSRFNDLWARVAGWGGQGPHETFNSKVRETCMQVKSQCCQHHFQNFVPGKQLCLLGPYNTDICAGDSGSPFVVQGFNGPTVIALVSYGSFECGNNKPTINTAVQYYVPWIKSILRVKEPFYDLNLKENFNYADITCEDFSCTF